ncbi:MAG TPA: DUF1003 domain-containing protein [Tepidisphaeraceae bacterium]|nr:DUF1003 domain-containing protein [Tepidisphaeraceae bacterium]
MPERANPTSPDPQGPPGAAAAASGDDQSGAPRDPGMSSIVHRNIRALTEVRQREEQRKTFSERVADGITRFAGSMAFVYLHAGVFGGWLLVNTRSLPIVKPFDPFPFVMLAMIASVEAIFLSTFILISQNRMQKLADRRAELDLQIGLLTEHELTRAIALIDGVASRLGAARPPEQELQEIKQDIRPEKVVSEIAKAEERLGGGGGS